MLAMWVKVRIKPDQRKRFLEAIEADALGSERDEPGCLRFNVLQDEKDANVYYFLRLQGQAALEDNRLIRTRDVAAGAERWTGHRAYPCAPVFRRAALRGKV